MSFLYPRAAKTIPPELRKIVLGIKHSKNKDEAIRKVYKILAKKYIGCRLYTITHFYEMFRRDIPSIWKKKGCLHCLLFNYLAKTLLVHSGWFKEEDFNPGWTLIYYISLHQYLKINTGNGKFTELDIWGANYGVKVGDHARPLLTAGRFFKRKK